MSCQEFCSLSTQRQKLPIAFGAHQPGGYRLPDSRGAYVIYSLQSNRIEAWVVIRVVGDVLDELRKLFGPLWTKDRIFQIHFGEYVSTAITVINIVDTNWWATRHAKFGIGWGHTWLDRFGTMGEADHLQVRTQIVY